VEKRVGEALSVGSAEILWGYLGKPIADKKLAFDLVVEIQRKATDQEIFLREFRDESGLGHSLR